MSDATPDAGWRRWLREPLGHFLLAGAAIFAAYGWLAPAARDGERIVLSRAVSDELVRQFSARWMRPPTDRELAGLIESWVRDEVLYREGLALGLDRDDPVIKRRVRQKLEVMAEERLAGDAPTDAQLVEYLTRHADRFRLPGRVSFEQVFFDGSAPAQAVERAVADARSALARGADPVALGAPTMLARRVDDAPLDLVERDFGKAFADRIADLATGDWHGPIGSAYGAHLLRVTRRTTAAMPALEDVRRAVTRDWESERRATASARGYAQMRDRYRIVIETGPPGASPATPRPSQ
ncbi:MAG: hypothetical protein RJA99_918 [Pseudomonadota bacterium]